METLKNYLVKNSEQTFALIILWSVPTINFLIPYKLVFLNFFFIVILLGAYYLGAHKALMGGVFATLLVAIYVYYFPSYFMSSFTQLDLWMNLLAWSSFLILTGGVVGRMAHRFKAEVEELKELRRKLEAYHVKGERWVTRFADLSE